MEKVLKLTHTIDGYTMQLKKAISKDQSRKKVVEEKFRKVFIVGLHHDATTHHIRDYFNRYGKIEDVRIIVDKAAKVSRGFGFVLFFDTAPLSKIFNETKTHSILGKIVIFFFFKLNFILDRVQTNTT